MGVPAHLLVHTVTVVHPAETVDAYNNTTHDYGVAATRTVLAPGTATEGVWLQQQARTEDHPDGRDPAEQRWTMVTNYPDIAAVDRIEWAGHPSGPVVFTVDGPPEPAYTPTGFHHLEATLQIVEG
jgi:hypothetical protein